ncbi:hypothetical protein EO768_15780 [Bacillus cereus]|uniref:UvrD-helicase domain-containing protein n=1 Tax=Bacillus cereus TaxID=1396 RepID=UPI000FE41B6B|nr:UvrD-helicase domain-containing protein [Bacillus cereus]RXG07691.1 hypothetical protein EO768_15780 [Bacillus cereus]
MRIIVAGAGAGKTTSMAEEVLNRYKEVVDGKIIYVITYTNAARNHIRNKIIEQHGSMPKRIKVETSHVFLLQEIIFPFYHLLYGQQYSTVSVVNLPSNYGFKAKVLKELKEENIVHVQEVTKIAKHVIKGKSNDKKLIKEKRKKILYIIKSYLDSIFIDEAQDIDDSLAGIIEAFYDNAINLYLVGDPKQDLRGRNELRNLIEKYPQYVQYKVENHRCPMLHVQFSNKFVLEQEKQEYQTAEVGSLSYLFEQDINISNFFRDEPFDYVYIYQKNERFVTNPNDLGFAKDSLKHELKTVVKKSKVKREHVDQVVFILQKGIQKNVRKQGNWEVINGLGKALSLKLTKEDKARMYAVLELCKESNKVEGVIVNSIDKVKGLEGDRCLFIVTTEISDYIFQNKNEQNKMLNYLYVALTRAKKELIILITTEVEKKHGREWINAKFKELLQVHVETI